MDREITAGLLAIMREHMGVTTATTATQADQGRLLTALATAVAAMADELDRTHPGLADRARAAFTASLEETGGPEFTHADPPE